MSRHRAGKGILRAASVHPEGSWRECSCQWETLQAFCVLSEVRWDRGRPAVPDMGETMHPADAAEAPRADTASGGTEAPGADTDPGTPEAPRTSTPPPTPPLPAV